MKDEQPYTILTDPDQPKKTLVVFGTDLANIPCFRGSFLYGIGTGVGVGLATFMFTSRPRLSSHSGFAGFWVTTFGYWFYCRYQWSKKKFAVGQLQSALQQQIMLEGTKDDIESKTVTV